MRFICAGGAFGFGAAAAIVGAEGWTGSGAIFVATGFSGG